MASELAWTIGIVAVLVLLVGTAIATLVNKQVLGGIPRLTNVATSLAEGELDIEVPGEDQRNEIGSLARSLSILRDGANEKRTLEESSQRQRQETDGERQRRESEKAAHDQEVEATITELGAGLSALSAKQSGDPPGPPVLRKIRKAADRFQSRGRASEPDHGGIAWRDS